jgi:2-aminoethylphosphonate dioxygenase
MAPGRHRHGMPGEEWSPLDETGVALQPVPTNPRRRHLLRQLRPHASKPNFTGRPRRILYLAYNLASDGDHRHRYYGEKHAAFPPDVERDASKIYVFRV